MGYTTALYEADIEFGKRLWQSLQTNESFPALGALWVLDPEAGEWRLVIASQRVDAVGTRDAYRELTEITRNIPGNLRQLFKIELISPRNPMYQALRSVFTRTASVEGARLGGTVVGGTFIDDSYLYEVR
ncbi:MAG: hypothetical protein ACLQOO_31230 [Terriglobia bacterium]